MPEFSFNGLPVKPTFVPADPPTVTFPDDEVKAVDELPLILTLPPEFKLISPAATKLIDPPDLTVIFPPEYMDISPLEFN